MSEHRPVQSQWIL